MPPTELTPLARHIMIEEGLDAVSIVEDVLVLSEELEHASGPVYMRDAVESPGVGQTA